MYRLRLISTPPRTDTTLPVFAAFWAEFQKLTTLSAQKPWTTLPAKHSTWLPIALNAWFTSMAHFRLDQQRAAAPNAGFIIGGYAFLENVVPANCCSICRLYPTSRHRWRTPPLRRSLRSGIPHPSGSSTVSSADQSLLPTAFDSGLHLLDGIREGQTLGALLGYRMERWMHDNNMAPYIETLRQISPF